MLVLQMLLLVVGFAALIKGADLFVDGSSALAKNFRVPSLIIGLTIVALGTSAPELAVSISAALQGANEIALRLESFQSAGGAGAVRRHPSGSGGERNFKTGFSDLHCGYHTGVGVDRRRGAAAFGRFF